MNKAWGQLADAEARNVVTTSVNVSKDILAAIDRIVQDPRTGYETRAQFWRQAAMTLILMWTEAGFPDTYVHDVVQQARAMREAQFSIELRQRFEDAISAHEMALTHAMDDSNAEYISDVLHRMDKYIADTNDVYWRYFLSRTIANNPVVSRAIGVLYDAWAEKKGKKGEEARMRQAWMEALRG